MTAFEFLSDQWKYMINELLFVAAAAEFALCICKYLFRGRQGRKLIADGLIFLLMLCICAYISAAKHGSYPAPLPWLIFPVVAFSTFVHAVSGLRREYRKRLEILLPFSVKQTLDNINSGILFANPKGRTVLVNHIMGEIIADLSGSYPQMLGDLTDALQKAEKLNEITELYRFPDGRIWRFQTVSLSEPKFKGFTQTTAQDMTELYDTNRQLAEENKALHVAIEKMRRMLERVAERVKEQEMLNIKVRVHNDIGKSLIALSELMREGGGEPEEQLHILHKSISLFSGRGMILPGTMEDVRHEAAEMRVRLVLDGVIPQDERVKRLIATAARECVTNCIRHAKGSLVTVKIDQRGDLYTVTITNDGKAPTCPVTEGSGLSSLRDSVEEEGGEMYISHSPYFMLILNLTEKR